MIATGGKWNPARWPRYFIASNIGVHIHANVFATDMLFAVNEIRSAQDEAFIDRILTDRINVFIDSGVYSLATDHATKHKVSMDVALSMAPDDIDGFDDLFNRYVRLVTKWADRAWGYVEIDQGGRENKMRTRARLEAMGIRPIPVYHPLNDGWDYFDHLAENYDRICFGNVVNADPATRKRLVATAWERRQRYPNLWIHLLGLTPSGLTASLPINSCDSSTWVGPTRWGHMRAWGATQPLWDVGGGFSYDLKADSRGERGSQKAWSLASVDAEMVGRCMRRMVLDQRRELGCDPTGGDIAGWPEPRRAGIE